MELRRCCKSAWQAAQTAVDEGFDVLQVGYEAKSDALAARAEAASCAKDVSTVRPTNCVAPCILYMSLIYDFHIFRFCFSFSNLPAICVFDIRNKNMLFISSQCF